MLKMSSTHRLKYKKDCLRPPAKLRRLAATSAPAPQMVQSLLSLSFLKNKVGDGPAHCGGASFHFVDCCTLNFLECKLFERSFLAFLNNTTRLI